MSRKYEMGFLKMSLLEDIEEETSDWEEVEMEKVPEKKDVQDKDLKKKTAEDKNLEDEGAAGGSIPEFGSQINTTDVFLLYFAKNQLAKLEEREKLIQDGAEECADMGILLTQIQREITMLKNMKSHLERVTDL